MIRPICSRVERVGGVLPPGNVFAGSVPIVSRYGLWLEVESSSGRVGRGEASPLAGFHQEALSDVERELEAIPDSVTGLRLEGADFAQNLARIDELAHASPSARFAWETALLDLAGQEADTGVAEVLGGADVRARCEVSTFIGVLGASSSLSLARDAQARGIRSVKLKASGHDLDADARALEALRAGLSTGVEVRLDLNGALSVEAARRALGVYARYRVAFVEEPCRGWALTELGTAATPWLADESLVDGHLADALVGLASCAGIVVKPALLGVLRARHLAVRATRAGKCVTVTHMFDGPIALLATRAVARSLPSDPIASGIGEHRALAAYPPMALPAITTIDGRAYVTASGLAGLGARPGRSHG